MASANPINLPLQCPGCLHRWNQPILKGMTKVDCPECGGELPREILQAAVKVFKQRSATDPTMTRPAAPPITPPANAAASPESQTRTRTLVTNEPVAQTIPEPNAFNALADSDSKTRAQTGPAPGAAMADAARLAATITPSAAKGTDGGGKTAQGGPDSIFGSIPPAEQGASSGKGAQGSSASTTGSAAQGMMEHIGKTLQGYRIESMLGAGGMGAVYKAHQISLDRKVALKVLPERFASNPDLLARFTREALSAAQLNHHNIIQVYDVGSQGDLHFISMELVQGENLSDQIKAAGRLQLDDAAAFVLQAARGLKFAHDHGVIHRDIKPGNLMVNENGVVKIADMGLAKMRAVNEKGKPVDLDALRQTTDTNLTMADVAMGTPAYMAPEQARNAAGVDHQADQYSLGCTLYYLVSGHAPHAGSTAYEIISKHLNEPMVPIEAHIGNVPASFRVILEKMLEKDPRDRYPDMGGVVKALEAYLGVDTEKGPFRPRETHVAVLEASVKRFYQAAALKKRRIAQLAMAIAIPVLFIGALINSTARIMLGLMLLTLVCHFVIHGMKRGDYFFRRVRSLFFGMSIGGWFKTVVSVLVGLLVMLILTGPLFLVGVALVAAGLAFAYQKLVEGPLNEQRERPMRETRDLLKELRIKGLAESEIQDFVCRFSGEQWEEFFEQLFGYEEMILARGKWARAEQANPRKKFAVWRDPIARMLDSIEQHRKHARERKQLEKVEAKRLKAAGKSQREAEKEASEAATRILNEGFVPRAAAQTAGASAAMAENEKMRKVVTGHRGPGLSGTLTFACLVIGLLMAILGALNLPGTQDNLSVPEFLMNLVRNHYYTLGHPDYTYFGLAGGLLLAAAGFSGRVVLKIVALIGAVVVVAYGAISRMAGLDNLAWVFLGGAILLGGSVAAMALNKFRGKAM